MKKLLLFVLAVMGFAACTQDVEVQVTERHDVPDTITVGFEGDDTRIQLNEAQKTVWTNGDQVSVFYFSDANQLWQYNGETGSRTANLKRVNAGEPTAQTTYNVVAYPFNEDYFLNTRTGALHATLPATQHYLKDSYGVGDNLMVAQSEFTQFSLKNVCGWLKLQLTGNGEVVKSITFKGNDGEQVAGLIHVDTATAEATLASEMGSTDDNNAGGNLVFDDTILTEVTLNCGEGVALGKNATAFYIALPPQTFEKGFTVEIEDTEGYVMEQSTDKSLLIERNHIQPMAAIQFSNPNTPTEPIPATNEIWYTATAKVEPTFDDVQTFGANVVSNVWDSDTQKGIITFDGEVTMIGDDAFNNCDKLTTITLPAGVTTIDQKAFYDCDGLVEFEIPDSVTIIGSYAFKDCSSLTSITVGDSVTTIGYEAFCGCSRLTYVTIGNSVTTIYYGAFSSCYSLTEFKGKLAEDNGRILVIDGTLVAFACAGLTEYIIPDGVTKIGYRAFYGCTSLTSVTVPDSVAEIDYGAFSWCSSLKKVYCYAPIPPSLGSYAFDNNESSRRFYVYDECVEAYESAWPYSSSIYGNGKNCPDTTTIEYTTSDGNTFTSSYLPIINNSYENGVGTMVIAGKNIQTVPYRAFYECISLTSITIPDSVTTIRESAFNGCTSLTSITIPDSVTTIDSYAFYKCSRLTSVTFGDSVTTIGYFAFAFCSNLNSVTIPDSVTQISSYAFGYCYGLRYVYCKAVIPPSLGGTSAFFDIKSSYYVPMESVDTYKGAEYWSEYASAIVGYDFENGVVVE